MMRSLAYSLLWLVFRGLSMLPMRVLYVLSDIIAFGLHRIFKYRRSTVQFNLRNAFPQNEATWLLQVENEFYQWFCDQLVETVKTLDLSGKELMHRVEIENPELLHVLHEKSKHIIFVGAHHGNWEWLHKSLTLHLRHLHLIIYKPLNNASIDAIVKQMREKFGAMAVPMKQIFKVMEAQKQTLTCTYVLGDQSPTSHNKFLWLPFMNQPTAIYTGAEELARKYDAAVVYGSMYRKSRGFYGVRLSLVAESPEHFEKGQITQLHASMFENQLKNQPAFWLWSHRRWKLNPQDHPAYEFV
ncbi:MAG: hypothetical protein C0424_08510 [Sphingobacteriaceae bacterium]|nr:hypothetical protein [Sphingobacteriaceae bacterium]